MGAKEQELNRCTSEAQATDMGVVSPLVRSIFENRKKLILDASQKALKIEHAGGGARLHSKQGPQREHNSGEYEKMLHKKVQALDEEVAIFKKESKRLKKLSKVCVNRVPFEPYRFRRSVLLPTTPSVLRQNVRNFNWTINKTPRKITVHLHSLQHLINFRDRKQ